METKIEKERRWLLRRNVPQIWDGRKALGIEQFYDEDGWRYRYTYDPDTGENTYCKLKKVPLGRGISQEVDIQEITCEEYDKKFAELGNPKSISKDRYTFDYEGRTIEVDDFDDVRLVILEIEDVDMDDTIVFPDWLEKEIIMEVTGNPKFSNYNLATQEEQ